MVVYETEDHEIQYCFPAINSSCIKTIRSTYEYNIMYVFFTLLSVWTVFLNLLVIISISHFKKLHTPTNLLILSLAVADLLVGLIVIPIEAVKLIETCWYLGDILCGLFVNTLGLLVSASLGNLVLIAVDRYIAVCYPLQYPQKITTTRTLTSVCLCWFCSSSYNAILVVSNGFFDTLLRPGVCSGECSLKIRFGWRVTDLFVTFFFPCALILTLYLRIFYVVQRQVKMINSLVKRGKHMTEGSARRKSEHKAALILGIIVIIHLLCYLPIYILSLTESTSVTIANCLIWTMYVNSSINPLVYALFYPWFRKSLKHILKGWVPQK